MGTKTRLEIERMTSLGLLRRLRENISIMAVDSNYPLREKLHRELESVDILLELEQRDSQLALPVPPGPGPNGFEHDVPRLYDAS